MAPYFWADEHGFTGSWWSDDHQGFLLNGRTAIDRWGFPVSTSGKRMISWSWSVSMRGVECPDTKSSDAPQKGHHWIQTSIHPSVHPSIHPPSHKHFGTASKAWFMPLPSRTRARREEWEWRKFNVKGTIPSTCLMPRTCLSQVTPTQSDRCLIGAW